MYGLLKPHPRLQAAGALRSTCVTDHENKLEFNREGGLKALVDVIRARSGAAEQVLFRLTECIYVRVLERQLPHKIVNLLFTIADQDIKLMIL